MTCDIIKIGTSKGIRLPAVLLKELDNPTSFEIKFDAKKVILIPKERAKPREKWTKAFSKMSKNGDDKLIIDDSIDLDLIDEV
jgi:antitoxin MazE